MRRVSVAAALAALMSLVAGCGGSGSGPVTTPGQFAYYPDLPVAKVFTDAGVQLLDKASGPDAVIDSVTMTHTSGFQFLGAKVAGVHRRYGEDEILYRWPPVTPSLGPLAPAVGATIPHGGVGLNLLIGLRVTKPGFQVRGGVDVAYHVGSKHYTLHAPVSIVNCPHMSTSQCDKAFKKQSDGW